MTKALNDDLSLTLTVHQVAETRSKIDCPVNDPDAILQILFSGRHVTVNWTIMGRSSLCYLMNGLNLMKGRRLEPISRYKNMLVSKWKVVCMTVPKPLDLPHVTVLSRFVCFPPRLVEVIHRGSP